MRFLAIDFETADHGRDSACAVGLVRVEDGAVVSRATHLIRPPRRTFVFTYLHGIAWNDVASERTFGELWPSVAPMFAGVDRLVAHNAPFDRGVLSACCNRYGVPVPDIRFECTVRLARAVWGIFPTKLSDVCRRLDIPLVHHRVDSDVEACAQIMIRVMEAGGGRVPARYRRFTGVR